MMRDLSPFGPTSARTSADPEGIFARVRREHGMIRTFLDDVERACAIGGTTAVGVRAARLRQAVWVLYLLFDEHLAMEEVQVSPILRAFDGDGERRAVAMILEHNEQRRVLLELVENAERDERTLAQLVEEATSLVSAFRADMEIEESALAVVFAGRG